MTAAAMKRTREEMENLATKCLILLSQGGTGLGIGGTFESTNSSTMNMNMNMNNHHHHHQESSPTRVFECKTCSRQFPSFQALGGHRASHKKPRLMGGGDSSHGYQIEEMKVKPKTHECSICGLEFTIGQALGGHMRRHRASISEERLQKQQKQQQQQQQQQIMMMNNSNTKGSVSVLKRSNSSRRILCLDLDLNLSPPSSTPAPKEILNHHELGFHIGSTGGSGRVTRNKLIHDHEIISSPPMVHWFF